MRPFVLRTADQFLPPPPPALGSATWVQAEVFSAMLGTDAIDLTLTSTTSPMLTRHFATAEDLQTEIVNARIWGGLHFRDAMSDAYSIGHHTARTVMDELD